MRTHLLRSLSLSLCLLPLCPLMAQKQPEAGTVEPILYGHMDQWVTREIHESGIIGGQTKLLYEPGPTAKIVGNEAYKNQGGSPWGTSNVMAKVAGIVKTNQSVFPEQRGTGYCARLETHYESVKVLGLVDIEVIAAGSVFLGEVREPIKTTKNAQSAVQFGIPFTKRPVALRYDYKVKAAPEKDRVRSTGFGRKSRVPGQDSLSVVCFLQQRWEDKQGNVFAKRIGTMVNRYTESTNGWVNEASYPIHYGDIRKDPYFRPFMRLNDEPRYTSNSKGESVQIQEIGWGTGSEQPTHLVIQFVSSHGGAFVGSPGNTLWIDNVALIY